MFDLPISIVIPAFNEENAIIETIDEIIDVCKKSIITTYEIIVVNDGSTDSTAEKLKKTSVTVVDHPHNIGYGRSLKDGIKAAQYDTIVITDADCTYPFDKTQEFVSRLVIARVEIHWGAKIYQTKKDKAVGKTQECDKVVLRLSWRTSLLPLIAYTEPAEPKA